MIENIFWIVFNFADFIVYYLILKITMDFCESRNKSKVFSWVSFFTITFISHLILYEEITAKNRFLLKSITYMIYAFLNYSSSKEKIAAKVISYFMIVELIIKNLIDFIVEDMNKLVHNGIVIIGNDAIYPYFEARILSVIITIFFVVIYLYILNSKKNKEKIRLSIIMMFGNDAIYPYFEARILSVIITIFFVVIYLYILNSKKNKEKIRLSIIMMFILNILVIIGIFKMISMTMLDIGNSVEYGILTTFLVLLSNICIILTINRIIKDYKIKNENKILRESVDKEVKNYIASSRENQKVREMYHDIKNHIICIDELYKSGNSELAGEYIQKIEGSLKKYESYIASSRENQKVREMYHDIKNHIICIDELYKSGNSELAGEYIQKIEGSLKKYESVRNEFNTGHIISDSILKNKKSMCDEYGINFECKVDFSRYDFLDMADFCTILSNLLDNAIEACLHVEHSDRYIKISNSIVNNFSLLIVENSKENEIKKDGSKILTSKKDKSIHGIGIDNVRSCVEKYNGDMKIDYDESSFKVRIMIPIAV